jgi:hypothetical protein
MTSLRYHLQAMQWRRVRGCVIELQKHHWLRDFHRAEMKLQQPRLFREKLAIRVDTASNNQ